MDSGGHDDHDVPTARDRIRSCHPAIGVTAGLLGGGAIALVMAAPSSVSAVATDDVVGSTSSERERNDRLRGRLAELIDDGTISSDEADAVTARLVDLAGSPRRRRPVAHAVAARSRGRPR